MQFSTKVSIYSTATSTTTRSFVGPRCGDGWRSSPDLHCPPVRFPSSVLEHSQSVVLYDALFVCIHQTTRVHHMHTASVLARTPLKVTSLPCPALLLWPILFGKQCPAVNAVHQQQQQQRNRTRSIVWHHHRGSDFLPPWSPPSSDMASETEIYYKKEEPPTTQCISRPRNLQWRFRLFMILFAPPNTTTHHHSSLLLDMNPAFRPFQQSVVGRTTTFSSAAIHHRLHSHFYQKEREVHFSIGSHHHFEEHPGIENILMVCWNRRCS